MKNSEYLFLAGAAGFSILPSILRRTGVSPTGITPAGAAITVPVVTQGQNVAAKITIKNTGYVDNTFGVFFGLYDASNNPIYPPNQGWYIPGGVLITAGAQTTVTVPITAGGVKIPATYLGTMNIKIRVNTAADLTGTDLDTSTGSMNITSGVSAQITGVTVTVV